MSLNYNTPIGSMDPVTPILVYKDTQATPGSAGTLGTVIDLSTIPQAYDGTNKKAYYCVISLRANTLGGAFTLTLRGDTGSNLATSTLWRSESMASTLMGAAPASFERRFVVDPDSAAMRYFGIYLTASATGSNLSYQIELYAL